MTDNNSSRRLSTLSGWYWFKSGLEAVRRKSFALLAVTLFYLLTMGLLSSIPYAGVVFAALFMPFGTAFIGRSAREALAGRDPKFAELRNLWADFSMRTALIRVGLVYGFILITVNALYGFLAQDSIAQWIITEDNRLDWNSVREHMPWDAFIAVLVVYIPGLMSVWFAPLLASEKGMPCGKSCFYSFFGCLRNIAPVLVLLAIIVGVTALFSFAAAALITAVGSADAVISFVIMPLGFILLTIIYASYWPMYESLFGDV